MLDCAELVLSASPITPTIAELRAKGKAPVEAIVREHTPGSELLNQGRGLLDPRGVVREQR